MYAVIETGGKQYRVELGTELAVELLDVQPGGTITLDRVLLVADGDAASIGRPLVPNASVAAEVVRQERGEKLVSFKYRPKARRRVKKGHRQELTVLRISDIVLDGESAAAKEQQAAEARKTERERVEEAARRQADADAALAARLAKDAAAKGSTAGSKPASSAPAAGSKKTPAKGRANAETDAEPKSPKAETKAAGRTTRASSKPPAKGTAAGAKDAPARPRRTKKDE